MPTDLEKLENLQLRLRSARSLLPQMIRKVAFVSDDSDNVQLFRGVAQDLLEWQATSQSLEAEYNELKPLIDRLNGAEELNKGAGQGQGQPLDNNSGSIDTQAKVPESSEFYDLTT